MKQCRKTKNHYQTKTLADDLEEMRKKVNDKLEMVQRQTEQNRI